MLDLVVALLACVVAAEYLVIGLFIVPRLARLADGRGTKVVLLAQIGAAGFFFGCAVTHITVLVVELRGGADANAGWHLVPHVLQVVGGAVFIWAVFTQRLSVQLLEQRGIEAEQTRTRLAAIVRHSDDVILAKDRKGRITAWNAAASRLYGYSAAEAIGQSVSLIVPEDRAGEEQRILKRVLEGETLTQFETERLCRDGTTVTMSLTVSPIYGRGAEPVGASVIARDVTERSRAAWRADFLGKVGPRLTASLDVGATAQILARSAVPQVGRVCVVDVLSDGELERLAVIHDDPAVERAIWDEHYRSGRRPSTVVQGVLESAEPYMVPVVNPSADDAHGLSDAYGELMRRGRIESFATVPLVARGRPIGVMSVGFDHPYTDNDLELLRELAERAAGAIENARLYRDARLARAAAERATVELDRAQAQFRVAFQQAPIGVALVSARTEDRGRFLQVNPALCRLTGYSAEALESRTFMSLTHPEDSDLDLDAWNRMASGEASELYVEKRYVHANGHPIWVQMHSNLVRGRDGAPLYNVSHFQDVTDQKRYEGELHHLADHDALTGLFNRRRLEEELERMSDVVDRYEEPASLLLVDLDNFKYINDTFGHAVGDAVISHASRLLQQQSRASDLVARLGGESSRSCFRTPTSMVPRHTHSISSQSCVPIR